MINEFKKLWTKGIEEIKPEGFKKHWIGMIKAEDDIKWITVNGAHIPIKSGQSTKDAITEHFNSKKKPKETKLPKDLKGMVDEVERRAGAKGADIEQIADDALAQREDKVSDKEISDWIDSEIKRTKETSSSFKEDNIFYRAPKNNKEKYGSHSRGFQEMPEKEGYDKVYMPWGPKGAGWYYNKKK